ncbi:MAG: two-component system response regulator [Granulosicoccus sp.]
MSSENENQTEVVIVDDDELIVTLICRLLKQDDCKITGFTNPRECLSYLTGSAPNFLFVDMRMPRMDGLQFLTTLQNQGFSQEPKTYLCSGIMPADQTLSQLNAMGVEVIEKEMVCDRTWLRKTLGFDGPTVTR